MRRRRIIAALAFALLLCGPVPWPRTAQAQDCGLPSDWQALSDLARVAARARMQPPDDLRAQVARQLDQLDRTRLFEEISRIQSRTTRLRVEAVLDQLQRFGRSGDLARPWILAMDLDEIDKTMKEYCGSIDFNLPEMTSPFEIIATFLGLADSDQPLPAQFQVSDYARLALLPAVLRQRRAHAEAFGRLCEGACQARRLRSGRGSCYLSALR